VKTVASILPILFMAGSVSAIVVADYSVATNPPTGSWDVDWSYVYNYKGSSAIAVGSHWLLTAAHVANDGGTGSVVVDGSTNYQQEIIFHAAADDPSHTQKADLALVRFDKPFPGYYPLYTGAFPAGEQIGRGPSSYWQDYPCVVVGFGTTGTVYSAYYTPKAWNVSPNGSGIKRWGTQKIVNDITLTYPADDLIGMVTNVVGFYMDFDSGDTEYEAGLGSYDSGGGTFVDDNGTWKLAGINTVIYANDSATPSGSADRMFSVSMPSYGTWVNNMIAAADGDDDSDGIPNWWEEQYSTNILASIDQDGDGVIGTDEYIADTNPTNAASFFEMSGFRASTNQTIYFVGSTARQYQLFYTTNDLAAPNLTWTAAHTNLTWGTGTNSSITVTNTDERAFYRLKVSLP
jgi:hypothetical protein